MGPYPADGFFGSGQHKKFDATLAMYHDQGLIPFKSLAFETGVNYTAGLSIVRTSPDHGTAFSIAGKNEADATSMMSALYAALGHCKSEIGQLAICCFKSQNRPANTILGLWQIEESVEELSSNISPEDLKTIESYHPNKQLEFLATRQLIRQVCEKHQITYHGIEKDEYGKPHLMDSTYHISVSHAFPLVGCLIHKKEPCGLDIEKPRPQLNRIKNKFLSKEGAGSLRRRFGTVVFALECKRSTI